MKALNWMKSSYGWFIVIIFFVALYLISLGDYLVFHFISEVFTIVIAGAVFVITLNTRKYFKNNYMIFIGISYLFIAILDLFHTLTYTGMPIYTHLNYPANQLWIAARYYESLVLFFAFGFLYKRKIDLKSTFLIHIVITILFLSSILWLEVFPDCFIDGVGLTTFKKVSEYIISFILLMTMILIWIRRSDFSRKQYIYLNIMMGATIVSELLFTFYISNYGISNLFGHYFKVISFIFVYLLIIKEGLQNPYSLMFKELEEKRSLLQAQAHVDPLTNLSNRREMLVNFERMWKQCRRDKKYISMLIFDIDDFKKFNDKFGHVYGDEILVEISNKLRNIVYRPLDIVSRHGGEEFVVVLYDCDYESAKKKSLEIHKSLSEIEIADEKEMKLTVSIGFITTLWNEFYTVKELLNLSDQQMYKAKDNGKNCTFGELLE